MAFIVQTSIGQNRTVVSSYSEVSSVAGASPTTVATYTVTNETRLTNIAVSGTNIATYEVYINGVLKDKIRTYFGGSLNDRFEFYPGLSVAETDVIEVIVTHNRSTLGDFNARVQLIV